jgi:flagellar hook-length control protein FliK
LAWCETKDQVMISLPTMTVPTAYKVPPALQQSGQGAGSFIDHLGNTATSNFKSASTFAGSTALTSSLSRKFAARSDTGNRHQSSSSDQNNAPAPTSQPATPAPANSNVNQPAPAKATNQTNSSTDATTVGSSSSNNATTAGVVAQIAAATATQQKALIGSDGTAATSIPSLLDKLQATPPSTSRSILDQLGISAGLAAKDAAAANAATAAPTQPALPSGTDTTRQFGTSAATFTSDRFGAPGATSVANQPAAATNVPPTDPSSGATSATSTADPNAAAAASATAKNPTQATVTTTVVDASTAVAGTAQLNARIVAGATTMAAQANTSLPASVKDLAQPRDPNATTSASTAANAAQLLDKARGTANSTTGSGDNATANNILQPHTNAATDLHNFNAALEHSLGGDRDPTADLPTDNPKPAVAATDAANNAPTPAVAPMQAQPTVAANTPPAAPADASTHPAFATLSAGDQVAFHLKQAVKDGSNEIQIQLKPASLGAIDVKLNVNHDGRLTAVISADRSDTLNLLKQDSSNLQQSLRDAGFSTDSGSLSFNLRGDADTSSQGGSKQNNSFGSASGFGDDAPAKLAAYARGQHSGSLDIQV